MLSATKDITVNPVECIQCLKNEKTIDCEDENCNLCFPCLSNQSIQTFNKAYQEHQKRGEMQRIFPKANYDQPKFRKQLNALNNLQVKWFKSKCDVDDDWC